MYCTWGLNSANSWTLAEHLIHQPTHALNEIWLMRSIKLLQVSVPGCHHQGIYQNKGIQSQYVNLGVVSHLLE
jgi:hypothetical protein